MGCGVSRLDGIFFRRMEDMKIRNSKKDLLLHDPHENAESNSHKINASLKSTPEDPMEKKTCDKNDDKHDKNPEDVQNDRKYVEKNEAIENERSREKGKNDQKECMVNEDAWMDADNEDEDEDEDEDDERMIGHEDDGAFPGSPSFRVYFKEDDEDDDTGKNDAFRDKVPNDYAASSKECSVKKKVKSERKKRSFRKALTKGLNVKSCYTSPRSTPDRTHLLIEKTTA